MALKIEKYLVLFYNRISGSNAETIGEIPPEALEFLSAYGYQEIIKPFVIEDLKNGASRTAIAIKYDVEENFGRVIGGEIGIYVDKNRSRRTG